MAYARRRLSRLKWQCTSSTLSTQCYQAMYLAFSAASFSMLDRRAASILALFAMSNLSLDHFSLSCKKGASRQNLQSLETLTKPLQQNKFRYSKTDKQGEQQIPLSVHRYNALLVARSLKEDLTVYRTGTSLKACICPANCTWQYYWCTQSNTPELPCQPSLTPSWPGCTSCPRCQPYP